jgi:SNF2-related domain/Helicase conserved C-terminal domain
MRTRGEAALPGLIERLTPEVVFGWLPDELTEDARDAVQRGRVAKPAITTRSVRAVVADEQLERVEVRIEWGLDGPVSTCGCGARAGDVCGHAAALGLMLVGGAVPRRTAVPEGGPRRSLAEHELQVRRERGASELFAVKAHPGARVYGRYDVQSPSSRSYEVTLRALDEPHNGCTCPDLATNLLGSCKHIEAVLHRLRRRAAKRFAQLLREGPPASYLYMTFVPEPEVRVRLAPSALPAMRRFATRFFRVDGRLTPDSLAAVWPDLQAVAERAGVEIPGEVARWAERARDAAAHQQRRRAIEAEVRGAGRDQPGFLATLYPYQVEGVAFLASRGRALLADDMGLGKTAQAIAAMVRLMRKDEVRRTLIVCPASLKRQWEREIERFAGLSRDHVQVVTGPREVRLRAYADPREVLITSYELLRIDEREIRELAPDLLILDEAQRIKNWRTRTADAVKRVPSRYAFVLTGTPLENRLDDLYSLMQVVDPHVFGPLWRFNEEFTELDERGKVVGYKNLDHLRRRVADVMRRRRKDEVLLDLPAQLVNRMTVPMTALQTGIHEDAEYQMTILLGRLKKRPLTPSEEQRLFRSFQRMRMACDAAGLVDKETEGSPKLDELCGLLDEICVQGGHKVVVFSEWERMQRMAADVCEKLRIGHVRLHGGVPSDARSKLVDRFFSDPACKVFLSTDAGGVGLNLQAASHVVNLDLPWNPAVLAQRIARVHRLGQKGAVNVVLLVSEGSFEERLETTLDAKRALFAAAVGDDETITEVSRSTLASRIATMMGAEFAAATGAPAPAPPGEPPPAPANDVDLLRARLGDALERVVRLPDGRLLGVVRGDAAPPVDSSALLLSAGAAAALAPLGDASPLSRAEILYRAEPAAPPDPALAARRTRLSAAERKLAAAGALAAAGLGGEALGMLRDALAFGCRAACDAGDPGDDHAALLSAVYGSLIPSSTLAAADAHALVRAGELARAFGGSDAAPPEALVSELMREARDLLARVRERLAGASGEKAPEPVAVGGT